MEEKSSRQTKPLVDAGFSLLELIIVISLIATVYAVAIPNFTFLPETRLSESLGTFSGDIRSAYDYAVLRGKPHRIAINMATSEYWLEELQYGRFSLPNPKTEQKKDPFDDAATYEEKLAQFEERMKGYLEENGEEYKMPDSDESIKPTSPLSEAKAKLEPAKWSAVTSSDWTKRQLGEDVVFRDIKTELVPEPHVLGAKESGSLVYIHFFPAGYAEKFVMHVAFSKSDGVADENKIPYTIVSKPYEGIATIVSGDKEVDLNDLGSENFEL